MATSITVEAALMQAADEANERIATCHERVACPRCDAPVGERCVRVSRAGGHGVGGAPGWTPTPLKHPHRERWTLVQPGR